MRFLLFLALFLALAIPVSGTASGVGDGGSTLGACDAAHRYNYAALYINTVQGRRLYAQYQCLLTSNRYAWVFLYNFYA